MITIMSSEKERIAKLEEKAENQEKFNESLCRTVEEIRKHLGKIELIATAALIVFGLEKLPALMELIH